MPRKKIQIRINCFFTFKRQTRKKSILRYLLWNKCSNIISFFTSCFISSLKIKEINIKKLANTSKLALENENYLFEIEILNNNVGEQQQLPVSLFEEIEAEL